MSSVSLGTLLWNHMDVPFDLIIRDGFVVTETVALQSIAVVDGRIATIAPEIAGGADVEVDATGLRVLPGLIDPHVHFNEPGRTEWEGLASGSAALAAGGGTCFFDMPLNSTPPVLNAASFEAKLAAAEAHSLVDFGLWGGLTPMNLDHLEELADCGVVGFKAFMCHSGIDDFPCADDAALLEGMGIAARLRLPVAVHAETESITRTLTQQAIAAGRTGIRDFLESRPVAAELEAIGRAIEIAGETRCALHIVHVSCGRGVALVTEARARGIDVSCETCPHYLLFTDDDLERLGAVAKCAPPLRSAEDRDELWTRLAAGEIDWVASDHSPSPPAMKAAANFFQVWGGIAGCQSQLPILLTTFLPLPVGEGGGEGARRLPLPHIARLTSRTAARRFGIANKGELRVGFDADLVLVNMSAASPLQPAHLHYRHKLSPYVGRPLHGIVTHTFVRGQPVFSQGRVDTSCHGRLVRPKRT